jgi:exodeoxyribonuclease V gamma subunit
LQSWQVGHRILALTRAGHTLEAAARAEWLRGSVPPGVLGERLLDAVCADVGSVLRRLPAEAGAPRVPHDLTLDIDGVRLTGRVITQGELVLAAEYSRLAPRHRLDAWLRLALLCAADPGGWRALVVARGQHTRLTGPDPDVARQVLADWLSLYRRGLDAPLALPPRVAEHLASLRAAGADPFDPENRTLERAWNFDADDVWRRFFPDLPSLLREQAEPLALLAWDPLLAHEEAR